MKVSINQPAYLPWLGYFERIARSDIHIVLDHVQFEKNSMVNRNKILGSNGDILLTVPVQTKHKFGKLEINRLQVNNNGTKWQKKHWDSIRYSYSKSPYFSLYKDKLEEIFTTPHELLIDILDAQQNFFLSALGISCRVTYSSTLSVDSRKSDLVLDICKLSSATEYLSGMHGKDYLDLSAFREANIKVRFQHYHHPEYRQFNSMKFVSHMSALDLLMNEGPASLEILLNVGAQHYE